MNCPSVLIISIFLASSEIFVSSSGNQCKEMPLHYKVYNRQLTNAEENLSHPNRTEEMYRENCDGKSPMHLAVDLNERSYIILFMNADYDVHHRFSKGDTIMIYAARHGELEALRTLLEFGGSVDDMNEEEKTPLYEAVKRTRKDICELLIKNGSDIGRRFSGGEGYLHRFVENGTTEQVGLLVNLGTPIGTKNDQGITAVHKAVSRGSIAILNIFIAEYKSTNCEKITEVWREPLEFAVRNGTHRVLAHLMDQVISNSCWYKYTKALFDKAVGEGNFSTVDRIFTNRNKEFLQAFGWDSLYEYLFTNNTIALEYLFGKGLKLKSRDVLPFLYRGRILMNLPVVKLIVSHSTPFRASDLDEVISFAKDAQASDVAKYLLEVKNDKTLTYQT